MNHETRKGETMSTTATTTKNRIARVNFTYAIPGGMWVERCNSCREWLTFEAIAAEVGRCEADRLSHIATRGGMTGMWYNADNGQNVYVDGKEVN